MEIGEELLEYLRTNKEYLNITAIGRDSGIGNLLKIVNDNVDGRGYPPKLAEHHVSHLLGVINRIKSVNSMKDSYRIDLVNEQGEGIAAIPNLNREQSEKIYGSIFIKTGLPLGRYEFILTQGHTRIKSRKQYRKPR